jgi:general stress protein YciG
MSKSKRGFALMDREKLQELARRGGQTAHAVGTAHEWTSAEAREMGRKGGLAVSANRAHMRELSRRAHEPTPKPEASSETSDP